MLTKGPKKDLFKVNVTALAKRIGRTRPWTSQVFHGHKSSLPTKRLIAKALGITVRDLDRMIEDRRKAA